MQSQQRTDLIGILILWAAGLGASAQFAKVAIALEPLAQRYPGVGTEISLLVSVVAVAGVILGTAAGDLINRLGARRLLIAALSVAAMLSAYQACLPEFPLMLGSRLIEGAAHLAIVVGSPTLMARLSASTARAATMGLWGTFFGVSFALTGWFGSALLAALGLPALLLTHAGYMALLAVLIALRIPQIPEAAPARRFSLRAWLDLHRNTYAMPSTMVPALGYLWHALMFVSLLTFLPRLAPAGSEALFTTTLSLASVAGTIAAGLLAQAVISPLRLTLVAFAPMGTAGALLLAASPINVLAVAAAMMFASGLLQGALFALVPYLSPTTAEQARANGALAQTGTLGVTLGVPLFGYFYYSFGTAGLAGLVIGCSACGSLALALFSRRPKSEGAVLQSTGGLL